MIRKLSKEDHELLMKLVSKRVSENLFIIGDVEAFGYDAEFQTLWGQFNESGELIAVLLKFESSYIPYAEGQFDVEEFAKIIYSDENMRELSGLKDIVEQLVPYIPRKLRSKNSFYYAKCEKLNFVKTDEELQHVEQLSVNDVEENVMLLKTVPEFKTATITVESKRKILESKTGRTYIIRVDGDMATTASTTAENSRSAMIVAVATKEEYKRRGLATDCMIKLCRDLLAEGKELCLFYDNPEAGNIYKRLGFEDIGFWNMYRYE